MSYDGPSPLVTIVDDEAGQRALLDRALRRAGYRTTLCATGEEGVEAAARCDLMLLDVRLPGISGLEVLKIVAHARPELPIILLTAHIDVRDAVDAIKTGAIDYLEKPVDLDELIAAVDDTLGHTGRAVESDNLLELPPGVIAESPVMRRIFAQAIRAASTNATILITGESGTGKDVIATTVHRASSRASQPFVRVNCGALPENLIESELFGHERGAFTGAESQRIGRFEEAADGTIFLDEVAELPVALQPKLLHVLEGGAYRRVGGTKELHSRARVISATNRNLDEAVDAGEFREDLYYRLNVVNLEVPPLRERPDDILPLTEALHPNTRQRLSPAAQRVIVAYEWPGNVRELRNAVERASIMASGNMILPSDLPPKVQNAPQRTQEGSVLVGDMKAIQRQAILEALEQTGGNKTHAAKLLGISRRNLLYKLREYGI